MQTLEELEADLNDNQLNLDNVDKRILDHSIMILVIIAK